MNRSLSQKKQGMRSIRVLFVPLGLLALVGLWAAPAGGNLALSPRAPRHRSERTQAALEPGGDLVLTVHARRRVRQSRERANANGSP